MPADERVVSRPEPPRPGEYPFGPAFFERLFDNLYDGVYFVDRSRRILFWNKGAEQLTGYARDEVVGSHCHDNILDHVDAEGHPLCLETCPLAATIADGQPKTARVFLRHKDGRRIAVDVHIMPLRNDRDEIIGGVEIFRDASSSVALESAYNRLRTLAEKDPLTGIANRRFLDSALAEQLLMLGRTGIPFCVVLIDIDHFKQVNDRWGHAAGDRALQVFAGICSAIIRDNDTVGRMGGEEFAVILPDTDLPQAVLTAERLLSAVREANIAIDGGSSVRITASIGVATIGAGDTSLEQLLARSDAALYRAKAAGRDRVCTDRQVVPLPG